MRRLRSPATLLAYIFLGLVFIASVGAPWIAPHGVSEIVGRGWEPPSANALFGTDTVGRDLFSRLIWGAPVTMAIALSATLLAFLLGGATGMLAGLSRGRFGMLLDRMNDVLISLPTLISALVLLSVLPRNTFILVAVIGLLESTRVFRVSRALAAELGAMEFVEVARLRGENLFWIIRAEVLPNALTPLLAEFGLRFTLAVIFLSTLSFLGLGIQPPAVDWGSLVRENKDGIVFSVGAALIPGAAIALLAISVNLVVDRLLERSAATRSGR